MPGRTSERSFEEYLLKNKQDLREYISLVLSSKIFVYCAYFMVIGAAAVGAAGAAVGAAGIASVVGAVGISGCPPQLKCLQAGTVATAATHNKTNKTLFMKYSFNGSYYFH
jgi:hypothetical protein